MAGDNMESLLLDDSSSGESDTEVAVAPPPPPPAAAAPKAGSTSSSSGAGGNNSMSQSEISQRLKSMYSPATTNKGGAAAKPPAAAAPQPAPQPQQQQVAPAPAVAPRPAPAAPRQIAPTQMQPRSSTSGSMPTSTGTEQPQPRSGVPHQQVTTAPRSGVPHQQVSRGGIPHQQVQQQKQQQQQQQQQRQQPVAQSRGIPHQQTSQAQQQQSRGIPHQQAPPPQQKPRGIPHQQVVQRRNSSASSSSSRPVARSDPYEPTPVAKMIQKSQQKAQPRGIPHQQPTTVATMTTSSRGGGIPHQQQQQSSVRPSFGSSTGGTSASTSRSSSTAMDEREVKKRKEKFLIFTRVLMKYLEQKDPQLHLKVKAIIKDCADRNKKGERGYESVTESMRSHLKRVVSESYWKRAEAYLDHFLKEKARNGSSSAQMLTGLSGSGSTSKSQQEALKRKQQMLQLQRQKMQQSQQQQQQQQPASISQVREDIRKKQQALTAAGADTGSNKSRSSATQQSVQTSKGKGSTKGRSSQKALAAVSPSQQRKTSLPPTTTTPTTTDMVTVATQPIVREYAELMEMVDHAVDYDWTAAGSVLGQKTQWTLSDEQKKLIYDSSAAREPSPPSEITSFPVEGWSLRNIVSSRVAWARLRLGKKHTVPDAQPGSVNSNPTVGGGLLRLPPVPSDKTGQSASTETETDTEWYNEETAEQDKALAVLSEGAEIYLKSVIEKALHCARQRQNLDGIRLWHEQHARAGASVKPALALRVGCDVTRQVARAEGNAIMTYKRQEEALERQSNVPDRDRVLNDETLAKASSMSDLSLRPRLGKAVADADLEGKRKFEIYGGKESGEPPFGRVPKQAKLEVVDFQTGMSFPRRPGRRHQAATISSSFFF